jgi:hypothetical protein
MNTVCGSAKSLRPANVADSILGKQTIDYITQMNEIFPPPAKIYAKPPELARSVNSIGMGGAVRSTFIELLGEPMANRQHRSLEPR